MSRVGRCESFLGGIGILFDFFYFWVFFVIIFSGRIFLPVEAFISLRNLPEGSFNTTVWEDYWPHL